VLSFFENADLLIFDAQYVFREAIDTKLNWGHSSNIVGVELAARAQVRHLCLFHHEPTYDDQRLEGLLQNTINYAQIYKKMLDSPYPLIVSMAYDGMEVEI
jgi:ribonuclease BN (tRNA processing enzyme)